MPKSVILHSDCGSPYYLLALYQALLTRHGLKCSMSAKGDCYDNACVDSFIHSLKLEAVHGEGFVTREAIRRQVFEYMELDYNRRQSAQCDWDVQPRGPNNRVD